MRRYRFIIEVEVEAEEFVKARETADGIVIEAMKIPAVVWAVRPPEESWRS